MDGVRLMEDGIEETDCDESSQRTERVYTYRYRSPWVQFRNVDGHETEVLVGTETGVVDETWRRVNRTQK